MVLPGELVFKVTLGPKHSTDISADLSDLLDGDSIETLALPSNSHLFNRMVFVLTNRIMNDEMPHTRNRTHCTDILRGMKYTYGDKRRLAATDGSAKNFLAFVKKALAKNAIPNYIDVQVRSHAFVPLKIPQGWQGSNFDYLGTEEHPAVFKAVDRNDKKTAAKEEIRKVAAELERNADMVGKELAVVMSNTSSKAEKEKAAQWLKHLPTYLGGTAKYLKQHMAIIDPPTAPPPRVPPQKKHKPNPVDVKLPVPASGDQYSRPEVFVYLASLKEPKVRSAALTKILEQDLVPVKNRGSLTDTLKQFESGKMSLCDLDRPWGSGGQTILGITAMASLCKVFEDNPDLSITRDEVREQIAKRRREEFKAKGYIPPEDCSPSEATVRNMVSMLEAHFKRGFRATAQGAGFFNGTMRALQNNPSPAALPAAPPNRPKGPLRPLPPKKPRPTVPVDLPTPASGSQYTRKEVFEYLVSLKEPKVRSAAITKILEQRLIPLKGKSHLRTTVKQLESGEISISDVEGPWGLGPMTKYKAWRNKNQSANKEEVLHAIFK